MKYKLYDPAKWLTEAKAYRDKSMRRQSHPAHMACLPRWTAPADVSGRQPVAYLILNASVSRVWTTPT